LDLSILVILVIWTASFSVLRALYLFATSSCLRRGVHL
jgi:hypothetical protein